MSKTLEATSLMKEACMEAYSNGHGDGYSDAWAHLDKLLEKLGIDPEEYAPCGNEDADEWAERMKGVIVETLNPTEECPACHGRSWRCTASGYWNCECSGVENCSVCNGKGRVMR